MFDVFRSWIDRHLSHEEALLLAVIVGSGLFLVVFFGGILAPVLTGVVLAFLMQGVIKRLGRYRVPDAAAIGVTYVVFLGGSFGFLFFVIPRLWRQLTTLFQDLPRMMDQGREILESLPAEYPGLISEAQVASWTAMLSSEAGNIGQWVVSVSLAQLPFVLTAAVYMFTVPILVFFFLKDKDQILSWTLSFLPKDRPLLDRIGVEMNQQMANYVRGKFLEIMITGGATYILFIVVGLNYAVLLAFLVGLSVIVPYIGILVVSVPVALIAYFQFDLSSTLFYLMLCYTVIQMFDGMLLVPLLFGEVNNMHPVAIIVAVLVFGSIWGVWGVFFAIPLATLIKAIISAWPHAGDPVAD